MPRKRAKPDSNGPLAAEQLARWENVAATSPMPGAWKEFVARARLELTFAEGRKGELFEPLREHGVSGTRRWTLNPGVAIGMRGRKLARIKPRRQSRSQRVRDIPAKAPRWVPRAFHPILSEPPFWARGPVTRDGLRGELFWGVYPPEDRQVYYPTGYPWHCVGKVYAWNDIATSPVWSGSGVLIGPRHVLTAGHVVPWDGTAWAMQFVPAYYDGTSLIGPGASSWVSDAVGWDTAFRSRLPDSQDIAVLRLFDPLGDALGHFGSKTYSDSWNNLDVFWMTGYPDAIAGAERPSFERRIPVLRDVEGSGFAAIDHHGDSTGGNSGGPFWAFWPDGFPYAVGTVSGGYVLTSNGTVVEDFNVAAGGSAMVNLIIQALNDWP
jgi:hypothetical protein